MTPNLAGLLVFFAVAAFSLRRWRKRTQATVLQNRLLTVPGFGLGVALFFAILAATGYAAWTMRPVANPVMIHVPASGAKPGDSGKTLLTAILVRERDGRVMNAWEEEISGAGGALSLRMPYAPELRSLVLGLESGKLHVDWLGKYRLGSATGTPAAPGSGRALIPDIKFSDEGVRGGNFLSLITPGAHYHLLCFATPVGDAPMKSVDAGEIVSAMNWLRPESQAKTYDEYMKTLVARAQAPDPWRAALAAEDGLSMRLYQQEHGTGGLFTGVTLWQSAFGPAWIVVFLVTPFLLSWGAGYRPLRFLAGVLGMLLLAVVVERAVAPAVCDGGAYTRFFTAGETPNIPTR